MRRAILFLALWSLIHTCSQAQTVTSLNHGLVVEPTSGTSQFDVSWWGAVDTGYFLQQSDDLLTWTYVPLVLGGVGDVETWGFQSTAPRLFLRLVPFDATWGDPLHLDEDIDGLDNEAEVVTHHTDPFNWDSDGDLLSDYFEVALYLTDPNSADTDGDSLADAWEVENGLDPNIGTSADGPAGDPDNDGLTNALEQSVGTDPQLADSDGDGLSDGAEHHTYQTFPLDFDSDNDGLNDYQEVITHLTDPHSSDTDTDTLPDKWEVDHALDASSATGDNGPLGDPDADLLFNYTEYLAQTDPHDTDSDDDNLTDYAEIMVHLTSPANPDTDYDGLTDGEEITLHLTDPHDYDSDDDNLPDGAEVHTHLTQPKNPDTDGDLMPDGWEITNLFNPLSSADGPLDADSDGINNLGEYYLRFEGKLPRVFDSTGYDLNADADYDGLTNAQELNTYHTDPSQPDTDGDEMEDGWEVLYGWAPVVNNNTDSTTGNDKDDDPDGDTLTNADESLEGTNPLSSDTDGDGASDSTEVGQASNPTNAASSTPPPNGTIAVEVTWGDSSTSHSEKYRFKLTPLEGDTQVRERTNAKYGEIQQRTFFLPKGAKYKVELFHVATNPKYQDTPRPDYDYTFTIVRTGPLTDENAAVILEDPDGILGGHGESGSFFAAGKSATLYLVHLLSETKVSDPPDRKRTKIGVIEQVDVEVSPDSAPIPTDWYPSGDFGTSTVVPYPNRRIAVLTAGLRKCEPKVTAVIQGKAVMLAFRAVQPTTVKMEKATEANSMTPLRVSMTAHVYIGPDDVSFAGLSVGEKICYAVADGYFLTENNEKHTPGGETNVTSVRVAGKGWKCALADNIASAYHNPPYSKGDFQWTIPWYYRYNSGTDLVDITDVNQIKTMRVSTQTGKATLKFAKVGAESDVTEP